MKTPTYGDGLGLGVDVGGAGVGLAAAVVAAICSALGVGESTTVARAFTTTAAVGEASMAVSPAQPASITRLTIQTVLSHRRTARTSLAAGSLKSEDSAQASELNLITIAQSIALFGRHLEAVDARAVGAVKVF
jgi:hypothetical protein